MLKVTLLSVLKHDKHNRKMILHILPLILKNPHGNKHNIAPDILGNIAQACSLKLVPGL